MNIFSTTGLLVFCALLGSVFSYVCKYCDERSGKSCSKETEIDCGENQCMTISQIYSFEGRGEMQSFYKGCGNEKLCNHRTSVSTKLQILQGSIKCCYGDLCNNDTFAISHKSRNLNNNSCPFCYKSGTMEGCTSEMNMRCIGSEDMCYDYRGEVEFPDKVIKTFSEKGCSNNFTCGVNFRAFISMKEIQRTSLTCVFAKPKKF